MPQSTARHDGVLGTLFPKVGLPSNTCANLCGVRRRATAGREPTVGALIALAHKYMGIGFSRLYGYSLRARARAHAWFFLHIFKIWVLLFASNVRARACAGVVFSGLPKCCQVIVCVVCARARVRTRSLFGIFSCVLFVQRVLSES